MSKGNSARAVNGRFCALTDVQISYKCNTQVHTHVLVVAVCLHLQPVVARARGHGYVLRCDERRLNQATLRLSLRADRATVGQAPQPVYTRSPA